MNALTWADIFRRHLLASQRHRRRARDAFPAPYVPKPPKWKHPDRAAADLAIAAAAAKIAARKKAEAERRAQKKREEERRRAAAAEDEEARKLAADPGAAAIREAYAREQAAAGKAPPHACPLMVTQRSSDLLFVPRDWTHATLNTRPSVGYATEFDSPHSRSSTSW